MGDLRWALAAALVIIGVAGTVLPALPGAPLVFAGLLVAASIDGFQKVGWFTLGVLGVFTLVSFGVDFVAAALGAKRVKASRPALVGATLGTVAGLFFGLPGLIAGPFLGAALGEYLSQRDLRRAGHVGLGTWLGLLAGVALKLAIIFTMLGVFTLAYAL
jgi:uncharacterized protein YqgC (DUF456 family)